MDLTDTIIPKSDQLNAEDLLAGPRTFTITEVSGGSSEQPVNIHLAEFPGRPFRPSKTVRRILVAAWGKDGDAYVGRRMTLYREPKVKWAGEEIGGIRISHLSHISSPMKLALAVSSSKRESFTVQVLKEDAPAKPAKDAGPTEALFAALKANNLTTPADALAYISGVIGREIASTKELTAAETAKVIKSFDAKPAPEVSDDPPDNPAAEWEPPADFQGEPVQP